jgi:hypothetical protein
MDVCSSIALERLERFQPNFGTHIAISMCKNLMQGGWCGRPRIWMIHIVEEIKLLLLLGNRLKHIRGNVRYLVTWNIKDFIVGYFLRLDFFYYLLQIYNLLYKLSNKQICYKETLVRSNHPMMILLCILYTTLLPLSGPLSQMAIAVLVCV